MHSSWPLTIGMINEILQQFAPLGDISQGSVAADFSDGIIAKGRRSVNIS